MNPAMTERVVDPEKGQESQSLLAPLPPSPPGYYVYQPFPVPVTPQDRPRNARRRRLWHFLACFALFVTALHFLAPRRQTRHGRFRGDRWSSHWQCSENVNWTKSNNSSNHPFHAHTELALPVDSKELYFLAEGGQSRGSFVITADADLDTAVVNVDVAYYHPNALDDTTVCRLSHSTDADDWGLGIFTPRSWPHRPRHDHNLRFHVHVRLPASDALTISKLTTDLPQFAHHLPELADSVFFDEISLKTSNAPIRADSLAGKTLSLHSSNGAIHGNFNTSKSLELRTSNAPIGVHVDLYNDDDGSATSIVMRTSNGRIVSDVALFSSTSEKTKGLFDVTARTSNAPLELSVVDAPVDSVLTAQAHTSNSPARVALHKTYEGSFSLVSSSFFRPSVEWDNEIEDPAGRGRTRKVNVDSIRGGTVRGDVAWEDESEGKGKVSVETSNSPLRLIL